MCENDGYLCEAMEYNFVPFIIVNISIFRVCNYYFNSLFERTLYVNFSILYSTYIFVDQIKCKFINI